MPYTHCGSMVSAIYIVYCPVVQLTTTGSWPSGQTQTTLLYCYCYIVATNQLATEVQRFAGMLRDCSKVESYSSKHNWLQHRTSL